MLADLQQARETIRWRERYLEALTQAGKSLLMLRPDIPYAEFLQPLGEATQASRVYVWFNQRGLAGECITSIQAEWCAPGVASLLEHPKLHNLPFRMGGLQRWAEKLERGEAVHGVVSDLPTSEQALLAPLGIRAIVALPLMVDNAWVGWMAFDQSGALRAWQPAEVELMRGAAVGLQQALRRKRYEKIQSVTYRVAEAARGAQQLPEFFGSIHAILDELMPATGLFVALANPTTGVLEFPYVADEGQGQREPLGLGHELAEYVLHSGEPLLLPQDVLEKLRARSEQAVSGPHIVDWLGVPLRAQNKAIGVLAVHCHAAGERFGAEEQDILTFVAAQVAMVV
jgi:GAF domain-containing protein